MPRTPGEWGYDPLNDMVIAVTTFHEWMHGLVDEDEEPRPFQVIPEAWNISLEDLALIIAAPKLLDASKAMLEASSLPERLAARDAMKQAIAQAESWELAPKLKRT